MLPDEQKATTTTFIQRVLPHHPGQGVQVRRILTDNGRRYHPKLVQAACKTKRIRHSFTRLYPPQTNGKAERFIQTALREWAYRVAYETSKQPSQAVIVWLHHYNHHRSHSALTGLTPASKLNNVLDPDT